MPRHRAILILFAFAAMHAQTFDAVSIRPNPSDSHSSSIVRSAARITVDNDTLRDIIAIAYGIPTGRDFQLVGPGWLDTDKFDIVATYPAETSRENVLEMMKKMLAERFALNVHYEPKEIESYALVVAKKGAKLKPNTDPTDDGAFIFREGHATMRAISMTGFANRLSGSTFRLDRPVVDMTELKGSWNFEMDWSANGVLADGSQSPSIFTALEDQLGLHLETRKLTFQILIVDSANRKPMEN